MDYIKSIHDPEFSNRVESIAQALEHDKSFVSKIDQAIFNDIKYKVKYYQNKHQNQAHIFLGIPNNGPTFACEPDAGKVYGDFAKILLDYLPALESTYQIKPTLVHTKSMIITRYIIVNNVLLTHLNKFFEKRFVKALDRDHYEFFTTNWARMHPEWRAMNFEFILTINKR